MATRAIFTPNSAEFPSANFPQLTTIHTTERIPVLAFDAATAEACFWSVVAPQGLSGTQYLVVQYCMASATSGKVDFTVAVQAVTPADALDLDASTGYDTANAITAPTVPGTAGYMDAFTCTLTNADSMAAGDLVRIKLTRDATDGTNDTATGDALIVSVEWRDSA